MWRLAMQIYCVCLIYHVEYYNLKEVSQPVVAGYNTTHSAVILTVDVLQVILSHITEKYNLF